MSEIDGFLAGLVGRAAHRPVVAREPVGAAAIHQWCDAMGERDPAFTGVDPIAPPATLQMWTFPGLAPGRAPDAGPDDPGDLAAQVRERLAGHGCTATLATATDQEFLAELVPGDLVTAQDRYTATSTAKRTALGTGYFLSSRTTYRRQDGAVVGRLTLTVFHFHPHPPGELPAPNRPPDPNRGPGPNSWCGPNREPDAHRPPDPNSWSGPNSQPGQNRPLVTGQALPPVHIPVTPTLIVAGALATRDFYPVHHDRDFARAHGNADLLMNVLTTNGLLARVVGEWTGHRRLTRLATRLRAPAYPHTDLVLDGTVAGLGPAEIRVRATVDGVPHAEATAHLG